MTHPDRTTEPGKALDDRLAELLSDAQKEAEEAKALFESAKSRHDAARKREQALRTARDQIAGTNGVRPPDASNGEARDDEHFERVKEARGEAA